MKSRLQHIILLAAALASPALPQAAIHSVKASLDSAYIIMGRQTSLHLEIIEDNSANGQLLLRDTLTKEVEVAALTQGDTTDLGNNRRQITRDIILQSFDSGLYTLPPIPYVDGTDTSLTQPLTLKVVPVDVDSLTTIHTFAQVEEGESRWWDFLPDWITDYAAWYILAIVIIIGAIVAWLLLSKRRMLTMLRPTEKPVPPYELAMRQLYELKERNLCDHGQEREFYTRLTEILRDYLERRFGINAMEMTSSQITDALATNADTREPNRLMRQVLQVADFVKFAKVRPLPDDNVKSFNSAIQFVESTRPVDQAQPQATDAAPTTTESATDKTRKEQ